MEQKQLLDVYDVMNALGIKKTLSYQIIRNLNKELKSKGYVTVTGKIPRAYFEAKCYGVKAG